MLADHSPSRRRLLLGLLAAALVGVLTVGGLLALPRLTESAARPVAQDEPGPVLLVPGYGGGTAALQVLADRLSAEGHDATIVAVPGDGTGDLADTAAALDAAVTDALTRTGAGSVDVVGFSAGGVVARLWAADGGAELARRVLTLGSPHHGTDIARLAGDLAPSRCPVGCQQLATGSQLLDRLNREDETPDGPAWISVWTTQDRTVTPPDSARLDGALNVPVQSVCPSAPPTAPGSAASRAVRAGLSGWLRGAGLG